MSEPHITIEGADIPPPPPGGEIPVRYNITDLIKNDKHWALYIQALILLQQDDYIKPLSWFAYSSIHGYPLDVQWQNGGPKTGVGYCYHSDVRFPTWHRPLVALYEQALQKAAVEVAKLYTIDKDAWGRAAVTLRSPYWDWADPVTYLPPPQVYDYDHYKTLYILTPDGPKDVPNPLLAYKFQRQIDWPYAKYPATIRHPDGIPTPLSAFEVTVKSNAVSGDLRLTLWKTLNWLTTWNELSNSRAVAAGQKANSLETLHNWIHNRTGANGHMGDTISAAFDPIFLLHHTNVDRQLAFWQTLHPGVWIDGPVGDADLRPFWKTQTTFHNSVSEPVKDFIKFRATYPEFVGLENYPPNVRRQIIQYKVNWLYGPRGFLPGIIVLPAHGGSEGIRVDWFVRIRVKKYQLGKSFNVLVFLGSVPHDVKEWLSSPNLVGSHSEFVNSASEHCAGCTDNADVITEGIVGLSGALDRKGYNGKSEKEIEKYIHDEIHWRIQKVDGTLIPASQLEVLEVAVTTLELTEGIADHPLVYHDITSHKDGGYNPKHPPYHLPSEASEAS